MRKRFRYQAARLILAITIILPLAPVTSHAADPTGQVPGRYIVKFKPNVKVESLRKAAAVSGELRRASRLKVNPDLKGSENWDRFYLYQSADRAVSPSDIENLLGPNNIEYIEPDYYIEFFDFPIDSLFSNEWYLSNTGQTYLGIERIDGYFNDTVTIKQGTAGKDVHLTSIYSNPPAETTKVVVAIVDSGVDIIHPQLRGRFWRNSDEVADGIDNDHNGYIDDTLGYDISGDEVDTSTFFDPVGDNDPTDVHGHGTHIAGIIAANADSAGVVGIAPWAQIMPVKIRPNATNSVAAAGIMYAVSAGAQIISISWGTPWESSMIREALEFARHNGVFVCIAPGNTGGTERFYPAAFDSAFVVAASNSDGYLTYFTTYGAHIDIAAPGEDILSLRATGTDMYGDACTEEFGLRVVDSLYYLSDGTSMATPMVAGAAALLLSYRPDLSLDELEYFLRLGASDIVDPFNTGLNLPGPDTISGYGNLNIEASLFLVAGGSIRFVEPILRHRYTEDVIVKIAPRGFYSGYWKLEYSVGSGSTDWQMLAEDGSLPVDSVAFIFSDTTVYGQVNLRLTDTLGSVDETNFINVRSRQIEISSPVDSQEIKFSYPVRGSVFGPYYDSMSVSFRKQGGVDSMLLSSTGEYFDSLLFNWTASGSDTGDFIIYLSGYFPDTTMIDSVAIRVTSAFAAGWPRSIPARGGMTPICADLNHDGVNEIIVPTTGGIYMFEANGQPVVNFPVLYGEDIRCVPAIYDVDRDGEDEIICTNETGIHVFNIDGTYAEGWPQSCLTGLAPYQYAYPNPIVTRLGQGEDSAIVIINRIGQILAYEFDGDPYFYSLEGWFGSVGAGVSDVSIYTGGVSPFVSSADLNGDGLNEVVATFSSSHAGGLAVLDGRTGQPAFDMPSPIVQNIRTVNGATLADLDGDGLLEVIVLGFNRIPVGVDTLSIPHLWVKRLGTEDFPGWPVIMTDFPKNMWIGSFPVAADLNLDNVPEILCTFFSYDRSYLCIFSADGSEYRPEGHVYVPGVTLATPTVANLTGDEYPEIIIRSGHLLPGTGGESVYVFDYTGALLPDYPIETPALTYQVLSSRYAPLVDDIDGDGLVELAMISDGNSLLVWDYDALYDDGRNTGRFLVDNVNSGQLPLAAGQSGLTSVIDADALVPREVMLAANYPNPFNPSTVIKFSLPIATHVELDIYNVLGRRVSRLLDGQVKAGQHTVRFDGTPYAAGVYFYRLRAGDETIVRKMVLLK